MPETADIRTKSRRVKAHILNRYLAVADKIDAQQEITKEERQTYSELTPIFAKNVVPRTQEVTGEDGDPIKLDITKKAEIESAIDEIIK